jgi:hypothetical protein
MSSIIFREILPDCAGEFVRCGYKRRYFFPHRMYYLPKAGPDGFQLAKQMCGACHPDQLWEIALYARRPLIDEFPPELFFDRDLIWHQQQLAKTGHIAVANLVVDGPRLYCTLRLSDLVQRISRRREYKTRVENVFKGWNHMLLNGIMSFAMERRLTHVFLATSELAIRNTDPGRRAHVGTELFERIYDRAPQNLFTMRRQDGWWVVDLTENAARVVLPVRGEETHPAEKTIYLCHDIERGWGHADVDPAFARFAHAASDQHLRDMLAIEHAANVKATYHVLGMLFDDVRARIVEHGHCLAFHSYDHRTGARVGVPDVTRKALHLLRRGELDQLLQCRHIDYRVKGYRPPQSLLTSDLSDDNLCLHNFEWLASAAGSLRTAVPKMENRIVKVPILFDDFDMYARNMPYGLWLQRALERIRRNRFVAFCLHDCYAHLWLPHFREFLETLKGLGTVGVLDTVAADVVLAEAA